VFIEPLLRNGRLFIRLLHWNGCTLLLRGLYLATVLYATDVNLDFGRRLVSFNFVPLNILPYSIINRAKGCVNYLFK
jgi:hypothetical protein